MGKVNVKHIQHTRAKGPVLYTHHHMELTIMPILKHNWTGEASPDGCDKRCS